ncbi:MAG: signal peptidase [Actinoplanes sp.]|nr:signal peptidase [Actinoplanes sp.]
MTDAGSPRRVRRPMALRTLSTVLMALMVFGAALAVASRVVGVRALVEHSDSMSPAIYAGDLVISQDVIARAAQVGDVVTFPDPDHRGKSLTHRVITVRHTGDIIVFDTRGDANSGHEQWTATADSTLGRLVVVAPRVGSAFELLGSPPVASGLNGVIAGLLVLLALSRWRNRGRRSGEQREEPARAPETVIRA